MSEEHGFKQEAVDTSAPSGDCVEFDRLFSLLAQERRRYVLYCLVEASRSEWTTSALVEELADFERRAAATDSSRRELEVALRHTHLPKLAEADVIDYDPDESVAVYRGDRRVERWVSMTREREL